MAVFAFWAAAAGLSHQVRTESENKKEQKDQLKEEEKRRKRTETEAQRKQLAVERGIATGGYGSTLGAATQSLGG